MLIYGDLLRETVRFASRRDLTSCSVVSKEWAREVTPVLRERREDWRRTVDRIRMTCEDSRRFRPPTISHLMELVRTWIHTKVQRSPWWGRPPSRERGALVDVKDSVGAWNPAVIEDWHAECRMRPPIAPHAAVHRDNAAFGASRVDVSVMYHVRFLGWSHKWDEFVTCDRVRGLGTRTYHYPTNYVHASRQWSLCRVHGVWDVRLVHPYAVSSLTEVLPLTDVLAAMLVPHHNLKRVQF